MLCSKCGSEIDDDAKFCVKCGAPVSPAPANDTEASSSAPSFDAAAPHSFSPGAPLPAGVKGWSWGAFFFSWVWAIGNKTWWGLLALIPYLNLLVMVWLGVKGREMAWKNKKWDDLAHFNRVQRKWSLWALAIVVAVVLIVMGSAIYAYRSHEQDRVQATDETAVVQADPVPINDSGDIDSNADGLPTSIDTIAGTLKREQSAAGSNLMVLNRAPLFTGEDARWQFPVRQFKLPNGDDAILMASSGGRGNSCETLFFFFIVKETGTAFTPEFGNCSPQASYRQEGDAITISMPGRPGFVFDGATIKQDGLPLAMQDSIDPSK